MANYDYLDSTGVIVPDTSTIQTQVNGFYQTAFGADIILTPDTPQGVLATADVLALTGVVNNNAQVANQINPNIAGGVFLDAIGFMTGIQKTVSTPSVVSNVALAGAASTVIPEGTQAQTPAGDVFQTTGSVTFDGSGNATVDFESMVDGPIPCAANALTIIVTNILGWETVTNPAAAVLGTTTQSDQAFRAYRNNTLAFQGVALPVAATSALYATQNVTSLTYLENYYDIPMGMLISITGGATLSGQIWGMTTTGGTGLQDSIIVGTDAMNFAESLQDLPLANPWPIADYGTTGNIALSGLGTQGGGDWSGSLTPGKVILAAAQTTASQNGLWVAAAGAWARQSFNPASQQILGSASGISLIKNSVYACVNGGADTNVAAAMLENKSSGCAWNGNTLISIVEPASGQPYNVLFDRPTQVSIKIKVTTPNGNAANVTQAVLDYAAGLVQTVDQNGITSTFPGFIVGADVSPFEIAAAIAAENPGIYIQQVVISYLSPVSYTTNALPIAPNEIAFTQLSYVSVVTS